MTQKKKEKEKTHFPSQPYQNESDQKCLSQKLYTSLLIFMQKWLTPVHFHMREKLQVLYSLNLINISLLIFKLLRTCFAFLFVLKKNHYKNAFAQYSEISELYPENKSVIW